MSDITAHCVVTGAGGFVGGALLRRLNDAGIGASGWRRDAGGFDLSDAGAGAAAPRPQWIERLRGVDTVIHCAGLAHQLGGAQAQRYVTINRDGTLCLAHSAAAAAVRRFIFISTAKVFGEGGAGPYDASAPAQPRDDYARSKWAAEEGLRMLAASTGMELVIIRPPLVYGPAAGANFARLRAIAALPLPLPIANVRNRRDMIGIDNLVDLIVHCIDSAAAVNGIWPCSDGKPYSLADIVANIRLAAGRRPLLFPAPVAALEKATTYLLGAAAAGRLFGDFELDISHTRAHLGWNPPLAMNDILRGHTRP